MCARTLQFRWIIYSDEFLTDGWAWEHEGNKKICWTTWLSFLKPNNFCHVFMVWNYILFLSIFIFKQTYHKTYKDLKTIIKILWIVKMHSKNNDKDIMHTATRLSWHANSCCIYFPYTFARWMLLIAQFIYFYLVSE